MKGKKGFQKGHPVFTGTEATQFQPGLKVWNDGVAWEEMYGENNPSYKNGYWLDKSTGYIRVSIKGKVYWQHRYIMEQYLGRKLERTEHVHHLNHIKIDNRIENLTVFSPHEHASYHMTHEKAVQGGLACRGIPKKRKGVMPYVQN